MNEVYRIINGIFAYTRKALIAVAILVLFSYSSSVLAEPIKNKKLSIPIVIEEYKKNYEAEENYWKEQMGDKEAPKGNNPLRIRVEEGPESVDLKIGQDVFRIPYRYIHGTYHITRHNHIYGTLAAYKISQIKPADRVNFDWNKFADEIGYVELEYILPHYESHRDITPDFGIGFDINESDAELKEQIQKVIKAESRGFLGSMKVGELKNRMVVSKDYEYFASLTKTPICDRKDYGIIEEINTNVRHLLNLKPKKCEKIRSKFEIEPIEGLEGLKSERLFVTHFYDETPERSFHSDLFTQYNQEGHISTFIRCEPTGNCTHNFIYKNIWFQLKYDGKNFLGSWKEQENSAVNFINQFRI
ncbi:MAG: hypothetical protein AAF549_09030 [Pseudomonadota bacterium]